MKNEDVKAGEATAVKQAEVAPPTIKVVTDVEFNNFNGPELVLIRQTIEVPEGFELIVGDPVKKRVRLRE